MTYPFQLCYTEVKCSYDFLNSYRKINFKSRKVWFSCIIIKIGTSTLAHHTGRLNIRRTEVLCKVISDLKNAGHEIVMVSSGAIGMGAGKLSLKERPSDNSNKRTQQL